MCGPLYTATKLLAKGESGTRKSYSLNRFPSQGPTKSISDENARGDVVDEPVDALEEVLPGQGGAAEDPPVVRGDLRIMHSVYYRVTIYYTIYGMVINRMNSNPVLLCRQKIQK